MKPSSTLGSAFLLKEHQHKLCVKDQNTQLRHMAIRLSKVFLLLYYLLILDKEIQPHKPAAPKAVTHMGGKKQETKLKHSVSFIFCCHLEIGVFSTRSEDFGESSR